jgi:hypothetical protein
MPATSINPMEERCRAVFRAVDREKGENRSRKAAGAAFGGERSERGAQPQRLNRALAHAVRPAEGGFHGLKAMEKRSTALFHRVD